MTEQGQVFTDHRKYPRRLVDIPAQVKISTSATTLPFESDNVTIHDIGYGGFGLSLTIETPATREDLSKMLRRRRTCHITCQLPGSDRTSHLTGEIIWVEPRVTSRGTRIRFGVSLREDYSSELADVKAFLNLKEKPSEDS
ncbi:hypothetical protein AMJ85_09275 [candidate division BRC1 bacterium SM23_51]|nr:MAG: hypothetical protein AMJ85_09275 [candidate division BRC1 bacterium SM23_51]